MSITKFIVSASVFLPSLSFEPPHTSKSRKPFSSRSKITTSYSQDRSFLWINNGWKRDDKYRRKSHIRSAIQPGAPPPSGPPLNFINWVMGLAITVVLPFLSHKWASMLKIKNEVDTAVDMVEELVDAVEKVADEVDKAAENIADDLPEGGSLRKAVDFVEHAAEIASKDAHLVGDFIDKVQEVEDYVESLGEKSISHDPMIKEESNNNL